MAARPAPLAPDSPGSAGLAPNLQGFSSQYAKPIRPFSQLFLWRILLAIQSRVDPDRSRQFV
jgi:hypothetical protein